MNRLLFQSFRRLSSLPSITVAPRIETSPLHLPYPSLILGEHEIRRRRFRSAPLYLCNLHQQIQSHIKDRDDLTAATITLQNAVLSGTHPARRTCNFLLCSLCDSGRYEEVVSIFGFLYQDSKIKLVPDVCAYNNLMIAHFGTGRVEQALQIYHQIRDSPQTTYEGKRFTYRFVVEGLVAANRISDARKVLGEMRHPDTIVYNSLIFAYLELQDVESANRLFNQLTENRPLRDTGEAAIIYATYMEYYLRHKMEKEAMESYQSFIDCGVRSNSICCNALLKVLLKHGKISEAYSFFEYQLNYCTPTWEGVGDDTYNLLVNESFRLGKVSHAISIFKRRRKHEDITPYQMGALAYNNIISKLYDIGEVCEADRLFQEMVDTSVPTNVATFRILFDAYFQLNRIDNVLKWFKHLLFETDLKPNSAFLNLVFSKLINKGRLEETAEIFGKMPHGNEDAFPVGSYQLLLTELCQEGTVDSVRNLLGLVGRHNIIITPLLHGIIHEAFAKEKRTDQIEEFLGVPIEASRGELGHAHVFQHIPTAPVMNPMP